MEIHIALNGQRVGPFSLAEVQGKIDRGELQRTDLAWTDGKADWTPLEKIAGLVWSGPPAVPARPLSPQSQAPYNAGNYPVPIAPPTSGLAVTSLVSGILSITFVVPVLSSIVAIITGHMARAEIKRTQGAVGGDGLAVAGLVTGYAGLGLIVAFFAFILIFGLAVVTAVFTAGTHPITTTTTLNPLGNGRQVVVACGSYAAKHNGAFPDELDDLVPLYINDPEVITCQFSASEKAVPFKYNGGRDSDPGNKILFYSPNADSAGRHVVGHVNGNVGLETLPAEVEKDERR